MAAAELARAGGASATFDLVLHFKAGGKQEFGMLGSRGRFLPLFSSFLLFHLFAFDLVLHFKAGGKQEFGMLGSRAAASPFLSLADASSPPPRIRRRTLKPVTLKF